MENSKKCPNCGKWSKWNLKIDDACEHCGELLQKKEKEKAEKKEFIKQLEEKSFLFNIQPKDNFLVIILKKFGYVIYLLLMAIASFLSWLLFWLGP